MSLQADGDEVEGLPAAERGINFAAGCTTQQQIIDGLVCVCVLLLLVVIVLDGIMLR